MAQNFRSLPRFPSDLNEDSPNLGTNAGLGTLQRSIISKSTHILNNLQHQRSSTNINGHDSQMTSRGGGGHEVGGEVRGHHHTDAVEVCLFVIHKIRNIINS